MRILLLLVLLVAGALKAQTYSDMSFNLPFTWTGLSVGLGLDLDQDLDGTTTRIGQVMAVYEQQCIVDELAFIIDTITSSQTIDIEIQDLSTTTAAGDGTSDGSCAGVTPATGIQTCELGTPYTWPIGLRKAIDITWTSTTGDITFQALWSELTQANFEYAYKGTTADNNQMYTWALGCDDNADDTVDRWISGRGLYPAFGEDAFRGEINTGTTPDEVGMRFTPSEAVKVEGICGSIYSTSITAAALYELDITVFSTGASICAGGDGCIGPFDADNQLSKSGRIGCFAIDEVPILLSGGTEYVVSMRANQPSADGVFMAYLDTGENLKVSTTPSKQLTEHATSRVDVGSWSTAATALWTSGPNGQDVIFPLWVMVVQIEDDPAGSGTSHGSVQ